MFNKISISLILCLSISFNALAQIAGAPPKEKTAELENEAVAFLRETFGDVANLRTPENRISFTAEMAGLMWFHDEKEAREMFQAVITDFRQMLFHIDGQINAANVSAKETEMYNIPLMPVSNPQAKLAKKLYKAMSVRQQIAAAVSEHDPVLAYDFFHDTAQVVTNPDLRKQFENRDLDFEMKLLQAIAEKDAVKGLETARKSLANGLNGRHIELLEKLYAKDAEKGAAFGEEIISKLKSENIDKNETFFYLKAVLNSGLENQAALTDKPNQKPMFGEQALRDVAELIAQIMLKQKSFDGFEIEETVDQIKKILPGRAAQIEQKIVLEKKKKAAIADTGEDSSDDEPESPYAAAALSRIEKMEEQSKILEKLRNPGATRLPDDERQRVIAQARKMVAEIDDPNMKIMALSGLAAQVMKMDDKETAVEIMREAERFVSPQPKNYMDFMQTWMLASSYAEINPDRAFSILNDTVFRLNETISAFVKVGEFIDVNGDFIEDGEVQVGSFGGEMTNSMLRNLGQTDSTLRQLAEADFTKTKALTNKFDRTEVRILAKMLVLRAILDKNNAEPGHID